MEYNDLLRQHARIGLARPCPACFLLYQDGTITAKDILPLREPDVLNAQSRIYRHMAICQRCARTEFLMNFATLDRYMATVAVMQDWGEAIRLPAGMAWGVTKYPTGGLNEWLEYCKLRELLRFYHD